MERVFFYFSISAIKYVSLKQGDFIEENSKLDTYNWIIFVNLCRKHFFTLYLHKASIYSPIIFAPRIFSYTTRVIYSLFLDDSSENTLAFPLDRVNSKRSIEMDDRNSPCHNFSSPALAWCTYIDMNIDAHKTHTNTAAAFPEFPNRHLIFFSCFLR